MIKQYSLFLTLLVFLISINGSFAQGVPPAPIVPKKQTPAEPDDKATTTTQDQSGGMLSKIFGGGKVTLVTDPEKGETQMSTKDGNLSTIEAKNNVKLRSQNLDLDSQYLLIDTAKQTVIARQDISLRQGDKVAKCGLFEYDIKKQQSLLKENPRIVSVDPSGKEVYLQGKVIIIQQDDKGNTNVIMRGSDENTSAIEIKEEKPTVTPLDKPSTTSIKIERKKEDMKLLGIEEGSLSTK